MQDTVDRKVVSLEEKKERIEKKADSSDENNLSRGSIDALSNKSSNFLLMQTDEAPLVNGRSSEKLRFVGHVRVCRVEFCDE